MTLKLPKVTDKPFVIQFPVSIFHRQPLDLVSLPTFPILACGATLDV